MQPVKWYEQQHIVHKDMPQTRTKKLYINIWFFLAEFCETKLAIMNICIAIMKMYILSKIFYPMYTFIQSFGANKINLF